MTETSYGFLFMLMEQDWPSGEGLPYDLEERPGQKVFTCFALPGRLAASGRSPEEAEARLQKALEHQFDRAESMDAWYERALSDLPEEFKKQLFCTVGESVVSSKASQRKAVKRDNYYFFRSEGDLKQAETLTACG